MTELLVQPEEYQVANTQVVLTVPLSASLAVCIHDDTQGVGGVLHLRYHASREGRPSDLTDNTLSSNLLLLDRYCKDLRGMGARKSSWRVRIVGHIPLNSGMEEPAASVVDLLKAYFSDNRLPVDCKEIKRVNGVMLRLEAHSGKIVVSDAMSRAGNSAG
jgi:chemotaxis receptor (MCP) glutamine deamidase CheD